jgi:hypothetical protein
MFDSKMTFTERLTDAVDLLIDFATLGEYGLEPVDRPTACESRRRAHASLPTFSTSGHARRLIRN